jgi:hypothetical protein
MDRACEGVEDDGEHTADVGLTAAGQLYDLHEAHFSDELLSEHESLIAWLCVTKMLENYEKLATFETTEIEKKSRDDFMQELKDLTNKLHKRAFPLLHRLADEGEMDIEKFMV